MAETYKKLAQGQLATSVGQLYACPANTTAIVRHIRLVNTDSAIHSVTMHHIDSGVTPSGATNILNAVKSTCSYKYPQLLCHPTPQATTSPLCLSS